MSNREVKIQKLGDPGKHLFVYSDRYNVFIFFFSAEEQKLYKITTDKSLYIETIDEVETPEGFNQFTDIKFFKPVQTTGEYSFIGIVIFNDHSFKFKIDSERLEYTQEIEYIENNQLKLLSALDGIVVSSYIQKRDKIFLTGLDTDHNDAVCGVVNVEEDKFEKVYYLYSDYGKVTAHNVNIDMEDQRIYTVGWIETNRGAIPFFDMFVMN